MANPHSHLVSGPQIKKMAEELKGCKDKLTNLKTVAHVVRNEAGQIYLLGADGEHFDMSQYLGKTLFILEIHDE